MRTPCTGTFDNGFDFLEVESIADQNNNKIEIVEKEGRGEREGERERAQTQMKVSIRSSQYIDSLIPHLLSFLLASELSSPT